MREQFRRADARYIVFDDKLRMQSTDGYSIHWTSPDHATELLGRDVDSDLDLKLQAGDKPVIAPVLFLGVDKKGVPLCAVRVSDVGSSMRTASGRGS